MSRALSARAAAAERVGLFGGSFDPVHRGHLHAARTAAERFRLEHVVFVPAARSPHKRGRALTSAEHRLAMLELALTPEGEAVSIWTTELERGGLSFTIDTVRRLAEQRSAPERPHLILGTDNLVGLPEWREVGELLARVRPIVIYRPGWEPAELDAAAAALRRRGVGPELLARLRAGLVEAPPVRASSRDLRAALAVAAPGAPLPPEIPRTVGEYARRHGIYPESDVLR